MSTKPKVTDLVAGGGVVQNFLLDDSASLDFQPLSLMENLQLPGGVGEREVAVHPPVLYVCKTRCLARLDSTLHYQIEANLLVPYDINDGKVSMVFSFIVLFV